MRHFFFKNSAFLMFSKLGKHLLEAPAGGAVIATVSRISKVGLCGDPQSRLQHVHLDLIILDADVETTSSTCQYTWAPYQVLFRCPLPPPRSPTSAPSVNITCSVRLVQLWRLWKAACHQRTTVKVVDRKSSLVGFS